MVNRSQGPHSTGKAELSATSPAESVRSTRDEDSLLVVRWVHPSQHATTVCGEAPQVLGREGATPLNGAQLSRQHAELRRVGCDITVFDLGSTNGTFINGNRVGQSLLRAGDVLRLGDCIGVVEETESDGLENFGDLGYGIFGGAGLRKVVTQAKRVATSRLNVLLVGETGTGKERLAQLIHAESERSGPILSVNCAVYNESTAAAEMFGYRKGAFTGAEQASLGHVRGAHRGTLFLDEVLDLPLGLQAKLLRAIEQQEVLPLAEIKPVPVDVRFVAAAQEELAEAVEAGRFRPDLRSRLEGLVLRIPPLRERRADVLPLFLKLMERHATQHLPEFAPRFLEQLCLHDWPMNIRELDTVVRRLLALFGEEPRLTTEHLDQVLARSASAGGAMTSSIPPALAQRNSQLPYSEEEQESLLAALQRHRGNVSKAAAELGISRAKAYRMFRAAQKQNGSGLS